MKPDINEWKTWTFPEEIKFEDVVGHDELSLNPANTLIIYTPAIPKENKILNHFINHHFEVNHFELIQSHLGEKGPHYKTLANFFAKKGKDQ
jgi:hypothetical protein